MSLFPEGHASTIAHRRDQGCRCVGFEVRCRLAGTNRAESAPTSCFQANVRMADQSPAMTSAVEAGRSGSVAKLSGRTLRDFAVELEVACMIDGTHCSFAELVLQFD